MSIFIFSKNSNNKQGYLYKIASSQSVYDANKNWQDDLYDLVIVEDVDYNAVKFGTKHVLFKNENQITYENYEPKFTSQDQLTSYINNIIFIFEEWLKINNSKPFASNVILYLNYIKSINVSSLSITEENPLNSSLEFYVENQGITAIHPLELL
jgi:hypothetical protein